MKQTKRSFRGRQTSHGIYSIDMQKEDGTIIKGLTKNLSLQSFSEQQLTELVNKAEQEGLIQIKKNLENNLKEVVSKKYDELMFGRTYDEDIGLSIDDSIDTTENKKEEKTTKTKTENTSNKYIDTISKRALVGGGKVGLNIKHGLFGKKYTFGLNMTRSSTFEIEKYVYTIEYYNDQFPFENGKNIIVEGLNGKNILKIKMNVNNTYKAIESINVYDYLTDSEENIKFETFSELRKAKQQNLGRFDYSEYEKVTNQGFSFGEALLVSKNPSLGVAAKIVREGGDKSRINRIAIEKVKEEFKREGIDRVLLFQYTNNLRELDNTIKNEIEKRFGKGYI